jgi:hypothetical protein
MAYIYNMADTWADAGTTFTAIKMNVTDTASNAASLLMDLQVGGSSRFNVTKAGHLRLTTVVNSTNATISTTTSSNSGFYTADGTDWGYTRAGSAMWQSGFEYFRFTSNSSVGWSTNVGSAADLTLFRDAANTLAQRNSTNAQALRVYNTFTDASNYERGGFLWSGNRLVVGTSHAGTGSSRALDLVGIDLSFKTGTQESNTTRWFITASGLLGAGTDNAVDIGATGANRPRSIYAAADILAQNNTSGFYLGASADVAILRDDANILAQRRGTNPQTFRVYNTSTDASNYERGVMGWSSNILQIGTQAAGTGSSRSVQLLAGPTVYTFNANEIFIVPAAGGMEFTGRARISSPALGIARFTEHNGANAGALELPEWAAAPAAPAANNVRIYAEDNGSGKTRLMARFATGAAVQIAIEP